MATTKELARISAILHSKGREEGLLWRRIYRYCTKEGETLYALYHDPQFDDLKHLANISSIELLMEDGEITRCGAAFIGVDKDLFNA